MSTITEEWRNIPGYGGWYQVSDWGRVRSWFKGGGLSKRKTPKMLKIYFTGPKKRTAYVVLRKNRKTVQGIVARLVAETWLGGIPDGMRVYHRDGDSSNNSKWNLVFQTGFFGCTANRKPVLKMDLTLEIVDCYPSTRIAAQASGCTDTTIQNYCKLKRKSVIAQDGFIYAWDDEAWIKKTLERAMAELDEMGIRYNPPSSEYYYDLLSNGNDITDFLISSWENVSVLERGNDT